MMREIMKQCPKCSLKQRRDCDGTGWLEPIGPCSDGSYITSRPCPNARDLANRVAVLEKKVKGRVS